MSLFGWSWIVRVWEVNEWEQEFQKQICIYMYNGLTFRRLNFKEHGTQEYYDYQITNFPNHRYRYNFQNYRNLVISESYVYYICMYITDSKITNFLNSRHSFQKFRNLAISKFQNHVYVCIYGSRTIHPPDVSPPDGTPPDVSPPDDSPPG